MTKLPPERVREIAWMAAQEYHLNDVTVAEAVEIGIKQALSESAATPPAERAELVALIDTQINDTGLWFVAETAPEAYLQQELRKLHTAVEALSNPTREGWKLMPKRYGFKDAHGWNDKQILVEMPNGGLVAWADFQAMHAAAEALRRDAERFQGLCNLVNTTWATAKATHFSGGKIYIEFPADGGTCYIYDDIKKPFMAAIDAALAGAGK